MRRYVRNEYKRVSDTLGVERYQSVPLYLPSDTLMPERYGRDGTLVRIAAEYGGFYKVYPVAIPGKWMIPVRYVNKLPLMWCFIM